MKKSLGMRFLLIGVVLAAWTVSLFPLNDRSFSDTFKQYAQPKVAQYKADLEKAEGVVADLKQQMEAVEKDSAQHKELQTKLTEAEAEVEKHADRLADYEYLNEQAQTLLSKNVNLAEYLAYKEAAKSDGTRPTIRLNQYVKVPLQPSPSNNLVLSYIRGKSAAKLRRGLDLSGGTEFIISFDEDKVPAGHTATDVRDQIVEILRNRIDSAGVVEPEIKPTGDASISLRMPSVSEDDKADIRSTIKQTAKLRFHLVHANNDQLAQQFRADPRSFEMPIGYEAREMEVERDNDIDIQTVFIEIQPQPLRGEDVDRAFAVLGDLGGYSISLSFTSQGTKAFSQITTDNVGRQLAIVLDGKVYSAPNIKEPITGGRAEISGSFTAEEARRLAGVIESGNLPVSIRIDSEFGTDPTLGKDSIRSGTRAALYGMLAVVIFMIVYYRAAGVIAITALAANVLLVLGTMTLTGATITMPGIAGIVLTIGMAVDANVLIFERIREERLNGKSLGNAVQAGYSRAFTTILDANLTTLITALILFRFGTGPIRGFAVTLSIGIIASMFTALFMTRAIFDLLVYKGWIKSLSMLAFFSKPNIKFLEMRKIAFTISGILIAVSLLTVAVRGRNALSIDFSGGTAVTLKSSTAELPEAKAVQASLAQYNYRDLRVGYKYSATEEDKLLEIVLPQRSTDEADLDLEAMAKSLRDAFPASAFEIVQTNSVGNLVGAEFQWKAIMAAVLAAIAIVLYVSFRFEFAYGVAAVAALVHDVIIAAGIYLLCQRQLSLPVVAGLLTIMGYSLNDTIVVFDRIREDLDLVRGKTYREIINLSINQTLSRTTLTSLTTLIVVVVLFLFGGGAINDFSLVMLAGVIVGTYSSIFIASAIIAIWHKQASGHAD